MKNCIIGLPVYNSSKYINFTIKNLNILKNFFNKTQIIFVYDKSKDNTLEMIKRYQLNNNNVTICINKNERINNRTVNIAKARNVILNFIFNEINNEYNYFIMLDCNYNNFKTIDVSILEKYFQREDWDCLTFNQEYYYDIWALSIEPYYLSCWAWSQGALVRNKMNKYITNILKNTKDDELVNCLSAFNGIGIYRKEKFKNCYYEGIYHIKYLRILGCNLRKNIYLLNNLSKNIINNYYTGEAGLHFNQDCEHRNFHLMSIIKNNAKIRISPLCIFK